MKPKDCAALMKKYSEPVRLLQSTFRTVRTKADREYLKDFVLRACESAERYDAGADRMLNHRKKDQDAKENRKDLSAALRKVARYVTEHQLRCKLALADAGYKGCISDPKDGDASSSFSKLLLRMDKTLTAMEDGPGAGWLHTVSAANLILPSAIRSRNKPPVPMGLLFQIVLYFRNFTAGVPEFWFYQFGESMPDHGEPHYDVAALFVEIALGYSYNRPGHSLRKFLKEHPKTGLGEWPT